MMDDSRKFMPNPGLPGQKGKRQDPAKRIGNFDEVAHGLALEEARQEASRCLGCKNAKCIAACPVNINIPAFIELIRNGDIEVAHDKVLEANFLAAVCGRVCSQETYCEKACVLSGKYEPVAIGLLERFAADWVRARGRLLPPRCAPHTGFKVAAVGSGPASLTVAAELRRMGHSVTIFEALHEPGGVLVYGIPPFRLPREIVRAKISLVRNMGVNFVTDVVVGMTITIDELLKEHDAVFIGSGVGRPVSSGIPGEDSVGVFSANEFLTRINLMQAYEFPLKDTPAPAGRKVVVIGGGNSAMDAARCAMRLGPESVTVFYRRTRAEMPARAEEVDNALEEKINIEFLTAPAAYEADGHGRLKRVKCVRMELGGPDASGRRRPAPVPGSEFFVDADVSIEAVGQRPNPIIQKTTQGLKTGKNGVIQADAGLRTSRTGIFAGGDIINGGSTVLVAMRDGKTAAAAIHDYLLKKAKDATES